MSWTFWPLADFRDVGVLVSTRSSRKVVAARFLTPEEAKAERIRQLVGKASK